MVDTENKLTSISVIKKILTRYEVSVVIAVLILFLIFSGFSSDFYSEYNMFNIFRTAALYILIALSQAMSMLVGGMNLSVGQIGGLTVVISGYCMQVLHLPVILSLLIGLLIGIVAGSINGYVITRLKLNSFVVTLAMSFIFGGLIDGITKGTPYVNIPSNVTWLGNADILGIPAMLYISVIVLLIVGYMFKYTVTGRRLLATGGNLEAARMSAVNTDTAIIIANILSGIFAALAAILWISRTGSAQPSTGSDWMLISFAVAVIGGTSLKGGVINPIGLFFSALLLVLVNNGLIMLNANIYYEQTYLGAILMLAVSVESVKAIIDNRRMRLKFKSGE